MKTPLVGFDYDLPEELIAQQSVEPRDQSRLLILDRKTGDTKHQHFFDIENELQAGDVLVLNQTKVFKARLEAKKVDGKVNMEVVLLRSRDGHWEAMVYPGRRTTIGTKIDFGHGVIAEVTKKRDDGVTELGFAMVDEEVLAFCETHGHIPIPPYVEKEPGRLDEYQTSYASVTGSVAAPTAGFHFTEDLLKKLKEKGVEIRFVTLHVGLGTFQPVKSEFVEDHPMHEEFVEIPPETANAVLQAKQRGKRVIAVGTTTTRALEGAAFNEKGFVGDVDLFITPGYSFKVIDGLITNFHLPKTTLLVLVSTFGGYENVMQAYQEAVKERYRFYSFGDAMFIR